MERSLPSMSHVQQARPTTTYFLTGGRLVLAVLLFLAINGLPRNWHIEYPDGTADSTANHATPLFRAFVTPEPAYAAPLARDGSVVPRRWRAAQATWRTSPVVAAVGDPTADL